MGAVKTHEKYLCLYEKVYYDFESRAVYFDDSSLQLCSIRIFREAVTATLWAFFVQQYFKNIFGPLSSIHLSFMCPYT